MERLLTLYSEVQSTDVRWLWYPFIAIGKITLLQGDPGDGKSTMMMNLIAELSTGGKTPDGCKIGAPQKVIYQCSEDGVSDTIKPRLERCGADCRKIAFINEEVYNGLTLDDERIRQAIIEFRPRLVVIDPIQAYLGSDSDLQIAGRARKLMRRLGMWAAGYDCAIVLIGHLNKKEGSKGLYRSLGSIDVVAAARSVLQVERDTENPDIRIVHQIKNSLAPTAEDIRFSISADKGFRWLECRPQLFEKQQPDAEPKFDTEQQKAAYWINIQAELKKENKKQVDLAEGIGVSKQTMSKIMNGARAINAIELHKISEYLHVSMDSLMKMPEKPMDTNVIHAFMGRVKTEEARKGIQLADELSDMILFHTRVCENGKKMEQPWEDK